MPEEELSSIPEQIHAEAARRAEQETERARRVAGRHVSSAKRKAEEMEQELHRELGLLLRHELDRKTARARMEVRNKKLALREVLYDEVLSSALSRLEQLPRDEAYQRMLGRLVLEGLRELGGNRAKLMVNAKDASFLAGESRLSELRNFVAADLGADVSLEVSSEPIECTGGVVVASPEGRVRYYNTFEEMIDRRKDELITAVAREVLQEEDV